ncbi:MAG: hypothetical protein K5839_05770, partial [Treponemataceae bacterium]|nr:hypothetical protein [Treponemataceae bacterium]
TVSLSLDGSSAEVSKVTGFTRENFEVPIAEQEISLGIDTFKQATIATDSGSLAIALSMPTGITQNSLTFDISQDADGTYTGLSLADAAVTDGEIDLSGQNLNTNAVKMSGTLNISADNATISFPISVTPTASIEITKFSSLKIEQDSLGLDDSTLNQSINVDISSIGETVTSITFSKVGVKLSICNGLPMDVTTDISSNFIYGNTTAHSATYDANSSSLVAKTFTNTDRTVDLTSVTSFDVTMAMDLGASDGIITLSDVVPGTSYSFYGKAEPIIEWTEATVNLPDGTNVNGTMDQIDMSMLAGYLGDDIELTGIKAYGYLDTDLISSGILSGLTINAKMYSSYTDPEDDTATKYLDFLADADTEPADYAELDVVSLPSLTTDSDGALVGELSSEDGEVSFYTEGFSTILNDGPTDLTISYDIQLGGAGGVTVTNDESLQNADTTIHFQLLIDLPFSLKVKQNDEGYAAIELLSLIEQLSASSSEEGSSGSSESESSEETDLFGRTSASGNETLSTVADFIEKVSINIDYENSTGIAVGLVMKDGDNDEFSKEVSIKTGSGSLELSLDSSDAQYMLNTYPFSPDKLEIQIPGSKDEDTIYTLKRAAAINLSIGATVETNVDYTIDLGGGN